jgi:hypothetical protein
MYLTALLTRRKTLQDLSILEYPELTVEGGSFVDEGEKLVQERDVMNFTPVSSLAFEDKPDPEYSSEDENNNTLPSHNSDDGSGV